VVVMMYLKLHELREVYYFSRSLLSTSVYYFSPPPYTTSDVSACGNVRLRPNSELGEPSEELCFGKSVSNNDQTKQIGKRKYKRCRSIIDLLNITSIPLHTSHPTSKPFSDYCYFMSKQTIVIVGGGSAGVLTAQCLSDKLDPALVDIILVTDRTYHIQYPASE
jgi:hypothetical protein